MADVHYSAFEAFQLLAVCAAEWKWIILYTNEKGLQGILIQEGHSGYL